ncbi:MAG: D-2-hydroxyacid dehydrogenase [Deltaproteobacteria bacterium]|nr:D-2-hydroxyacid dehydrogenase [Deltaproteobacteria bacterium]
MVITVLDGYTLNPGDLSWAPLKALGDCTVYDRTPPERTIERSRDAGNLLTNKVVVSAAAIEQSPGLEYIGLLATGYDVVDIAAADRRGITVTNVPAYGTVSVAQMVFAHLLNLCHHVADHSDKVREGAWSRSEDFCFWDHPLIELNGLTIGIVGLGRIGLATAGLAAALGMKIMASDITPPRSCPHPVQMVDLDTLFRQSDVISLHCPLTPDTYHLIDRDRLQKMKPTAFLINTSRGPLVDESALVEALTTHALAGAGLDVLEKEPPGPDCPLFNAPNCFITPHIAWATKSARQRLLSAAVDNVKAFLEHSPRNVVNHPVISS